MQFGADGLTAMFGVKLAGVKLLFPFTGIESLRSSESSDRQPPDNLAWPVAIGLIALLAAKLFSDKQACDREATLKKWEQNELQVMWSRHLTVLHMLRSEAEKKQKASNVLIKGAYFGLKDNLKKMIAGQLAMLTFERSSYVEQFEPFSEQQFVIDVTLPTRYLLEPNSLQLAAHQPKQSLLGFFNPVPPHLKQPPTLLIVYCLKENDQPIAEFFTD